MYRVFLYFLFCTFQSIYLCCRFRVSDNDDEYRNDESYDDGNDDGYVDKHCGVGGDA